MQSTRPEVPEFMESGILSRSPVCHLESKDLLFAWLRIHLRSMKTGPITEIFEIAPPPEPEQTGEIIPNADLAT